MNHSVVPMLVGVFRGRGELRRRVATLSPCSWGCSARIAACGAVRQALSPCSWGCSVQNVNRKIISIQLSPCSWGCSAHPRLDQRIDNRCPHARGGVPLFHAVAKIFARVVPMLVGVFRAVTCAAVGLILVVPMLVGVFRNWHL